MPLGLTNRDFLVTIAKFADHLVMEQLNNLQSQLTDALNKILLDLWDAQYKGEMPPANFAIHARAAILDAKALLGATDDEIKRFIVELNALRFEMTEGRTLERSAIIGRIEEIYSGIWKQEIKISAMLARVRGVNLEL